MGIDVMTLILAMSIPSAFTGFCFWWLERKIIQRDEKDKAERERRQKDIDEKDLVQKESILVISKSVDASLELSIAIAKAIQRIPDAKCNGDMHAALEYAESKKKERDEFKLKQAVNNIFS